MNGTVLVGGNQYREVKRKANVGERIKIVDAQLTCDMYKNGDTFTVDKAGRNNHVYCNAVKTPLGNIDGIIDFSEYVVLEPVETAGDAESVQRTLDGLTATVANLARRLTEAERVIAELKPQAINVKQAPLTRDDVIAQAKWELTELATRRTHRVEGGEKLPLYQSPNGRGCYVEFIVNREKRTVVALLRGWDSETVHARGIAKCTPDDVFNTHIGRAISLRRALGLTVPAEYLNAPKPESVRVGDIVTYNDSDAGEVLYRVDSLDKSGENCTVIYSHWGADSVGIRAFGESYSWARIIDDSRESYAEGEVSA